MVKKRAFTGLQPSGALHIGNYFGSIKPFLDLYGEYESLLCVVDYHALTTVRSGEDMRRNTLELARGFLAAGVDPAQATVFKQSQVPEHTELAWILNCVTPVAMLELAHAYKDTAGKGKEATTGLFTYPVLMAADIILYDTEVVPVGEDQRQHVEYAREIAGKFNRTFKELFVEPQERIYESVAVIQGTDGRKMSKSYKNTIPLFATRAELSKIVMGIVTDSKGERPENVFAIHSLVKEKEALEGLYASNAKNYKVLKEALVEDLDAFIAPMREKYASLSDEEVTRVLDEGSEKARAIAQKKMAAVREAIGVA